MKADSFRINKVFSGGGDIHYILPHFQREYTWDRPQWQTLFADALSLHDEMEAGGDNASESGTASSVATPRQDLEHFLGALVVISDGIRNGTIPAFKLVDGQQRLTSVSLLLCALARVAEGQSNRSLTRKIRKLLVNADEEEEDTLYFKLLPTTKYGDRSAYTALLRGETVPVPCASRIPPAFEYFVGEIKAKNAAGALDFERFFQVLTQSFQIVFIDLNRDESPYRIFESLNGKGKPLTQADLVRNYIAMRLPADEQEKAFEKHWSKVEDVLHERRLVGRSRLGELTAFLRHYLAMRTGVLCSEEHVYARFRDRAERDFASDSSFAGELSALARFAVYYDKMLRPEHEADGLLREGLRRLSVLEVSTAFPFLLAVFDGQDAGEISRNQLLNVFGVLENYLVRRMLAGEPTNFLNKVFPGLWGQMSGFDPISTLKTVLGGRGYPSDARVRAALTVRSLYDKSDLTRSRTGLVLESINRHLSAGSGGYTVLSGSPTIEHILPQSLSPEWRDELGGGEPEVTHRELLQTLGNLTLITQDWNSSLSNAPFALKRSRLATHALKINADYFGQDTVTNWDARAIQARGSYLTDQILAIWPAFAGSAALPAVKKTTSPPANFHQSVVNRVGQYLHVSFKRHEAAQVAYATADGASRLMVAVSKTYEITNGIRFWYGFYPSQQTFLENASNGYVAFGCGSAEKVVLFPIMVFALYLANMGRTTRGDKFYYHVVIKQQSDGTLQLEQPLLGAGAKADITAYLLPAQK